MLQVLLLMAILNAPAQLQSITPLNAANTQLVWDKFPTAVEYNIYCGDPRDKDADYSYFPVERVVNDVNVTSFLALPLVDEAMTWYNTNLLQLRCWVSAVDANKVETWLAPSWQPLYPLTERK